MRELMLMRHAKSSWKDAELADHDRPLNKRGLRDAPRMGHWIAEHDRVPDFVLASTARRARDTALYLTDSADCGAPVEFTADLYHATGPSIISTVAGVSPRARRVMVVGHNPGLEDALALLVRQHETMPTASLAHLRLNVEDWSELDEDTAAELLGVWRPRELFA